MSITPRYNQPCSAWAALTPVASPHGQVSQSLIPWRLLFPPALHGHPGNSKTLLPPVIGCSHFYLTKGFKLRNKVCTAKTGKHKNPLSGLAKPSGTELSITIHSNRPSLSKILFKTRWRAREIALQFRVLAVLVEDTGKVPTPT